MHYKFFPLKSQSSILPKTWEHLQCAFTEEDKIFGKVQFA